MENFSLTDIKKKNRFDVYHFIYSNPGSSKQAIATALNMSLPTVSQHLITLSSEELIEKTGQLSSSIGRKAAAYSAISAARIAVGIEILQDVVFLIAVDLSGHKTAKEKILLDFSPDDEYFHELGQQVCAFLARHNIDTSRLLGIGLGVQGLVSADGRTITYGQILNCTGLRIAPFAELFPVPCRFIHDAECAANSELWDNPELENAIYLSLGHHLGGAIILDGKLQRGISGKSGTFEHMTLVPHGRFCYCGRRGCAECYCSAAALIEGDREVAAEAAISEMASMDTDTFFSRKAGGDPLCQSRWADYLHNLAVLINNLHMVMENTVILGGHITPYFTDEDVAALRQEVLSLSTFGDPADYILPGKCRADAVSRGAALPFVQEFLNTLSM